MGELQNLTSQMNNAVCHTKSEHQSENSKIDHKSTVGFERISNKMEKFFARI